MSAYRNQPGVCCGCGRWVADVPSHYGTCAALDEALGPVEGNVPRRYDNPAYWLTVTCPCGAVVEARSRNRRYCAACLGRRVADRMRRIYAARKGGTVRPMRRWRYGAIRE